MRELEEGCRLLVLEAGVSPPALAEADPSQEAVCTQAGMMCARCFLNWSRSRQYSCSVRRDSW